MLIRYLFVSAFAAILSMMALPALANDWVSERSWSEDAGGHKTWSQMQSEHFEPFEGVLSRGFGESVIWVKLKIQPPPSANHSEPLVLRVRPMYLDDLQVFEAASPDVPVASTGDTHHPSSEAMRGLDFMVDLPPGPLPRDVWLRVTSSSTRQIYAQVIPQAKLFQETPSQHLMFALYVAVVVVFAFWAISYRVFTKDALVGLFGLKQAAALVYALCSLGYLRIWWPVHWPAAWLDQLSSLFSMLATGAAIFFHYAFLRDYRPHPWFTWMLRALIALLPLNLILSFLMGQTTLALQLNMSSVLFAPFVFFGAALSVKLPSGQDAPNSSELVLLPRALVQGFYAVLIVMLLFAALPGLGLTRGGEISLYLVQAHGLASGLMVLLILQYRSYLMRKSQLSAYALLATTQLQADQERAQRQEQEKLLAMLAHEIKTPLSTMLMRLDERSKDASSIKQSIREMNGVIERCIQANRLQDHKLEAHFESIDLLQSITDAIASSPAPDRITPQLLPSMHIRSDSQLLSIVLGNLLENACKYCSKDGFIDLFLREAPDTVQISICNEPGRAGFPQPDKVFEKYYRSPGAQGQAGTGLGLYLVRNLVQVLGGEVSYQPTDHSVCFVIRLPKATAA